MRAVKKTLAQWQALADDDLYQLHYEAHDRVLRATLRKLSRRLAKAHPELKHTFLSLDWAEPSDVEAAMILKAKRGGVR